MKLNDAKIRALKGAAKTYRRADGHGLNLEITPKGVRHWRLRYRFEGKATMIGLGTWPEVSLAEAREAAQQQRRLLKAGLNPTEERRR